MNLSDKDGKFTNEPIGFVQIQFLDFVLEASPRLILRRNGNPIARRDHRLQLLRLLLERACHGRDLDSRLVYTREIFQKVWRGDSQVNREWNVHKTVERLRELLKDETKEIVEVIPGDGYAIGEKIEVTVEKVFDKSRTTDVPETNPEEVTSAGTPSTNQQTVAYVLVELYREYGTSEMRDALQAIWHQPPNSFDSDPARDQQRRRVLHFWELVASLVKNDSTLEGSLRDRYRDQVSVWERLKPIQVRATTRVTRDRHPQLEISRAEAWAGRAVETSNIEWLYKRWKGERRNLFRDADL